MSSRAKLGALRGERAFDAVRRYGSQQRVAPWLILRFRRNDEANSKIGLIIPKQVGGAVIRNRLRRWCKEFFRLEPEVADGGVDVVVVFLRGSQGPLAELTRSELDALLRTAWQRARRDRRFSGVS